MHSKYFCTFALGFGTVKKCTRSNLNKIGTFLYTEGADVFQRFEATKVFLGYEEVYYGIERVYLVLG